MSKVFLRVGVFGVFLTAFSALAWWNTTPSITWGTFKMTYKADGYMQGNFVECLRGLIIGANNWSVTGTATTETNRGASYLEADVLLYDGSGYLGRDDQKYIQGPRSAIIAKYTETRRCFGSYTTMFTGGAFNIKSYHKARPMSTDADYSLGSRDATDSKNL